MTSSRMSCKNSKVLSFPAQYTLSSTPHLLRSSNGPPVHEYSGYAVKAASACPGSSTSGITVMYRSAA